MTLHSDILARFSGEGGAAPLFLPDLTLWHAWHRERIHSRQPGVTSVCRKPPATSMRLSGQSAALAGRYTRGHHHERGKRRGARHPPRNIFRDAHDALHRGQTATGG